MITLLPPTGKPIRMSGRVPQPELLQSADRALADRNLHDIARINRWFGGHRTLLGVLNELASRASKFSVLDKQSSVSTGRGKRSHKNRPRTSARCYDPALMHLRPALPR